MINEAENPVQSSCSEQNQVWESIESSKPFKIPPQNYPQSFCNIEKQKQKQFSKEMKSILTLLNKDYFRKEPYKILDDLFKQELVSNSQYEQLKSQKKLKKNFDYLISTFRRQFKISKNELSNDVYLQKANKRVFSNEPGQKQVQKSDLNKEQKNQTKNSDENESKNQKTTTTEEISSQFETKSNSDQFSIFFTEDLPQFQNQEINWFKIQNQF